MKFCLVLCFNAIFLFGAEIYASFDVYAVHNSKLAMQSMGVVSEIYVGIGDEVKKDQILLKLDTKSEEILLETSKNDLEMSKQSQIYTKNMLNKFKKVKDVTSAQTYEDIKFKYDSAQNAFNKAKIGIKKAEDLIEKKLLKAPFDGVIEAKLTEVGEGVGGVMQPLFIISSYPFVKLVLSFDEKYYNVVKKGDIFRYKVDNSNQEFEGKIEKIYPSIDIKSRKVIAEVHLEKPLTLGMFGEGYIITRD